MKTRKQIEGVIKSYKYNLIQTRKLYGHYSEREDFFKGGIKMLLWVLKEDGGLKIPEHYEEGAAHSVRDESVNDVAFLTDEIVEEQS